MKRLSQILFAFGLVILGACAGQQTTDTPEPERLNSRFEHRNPRL